MYNINVIIYTIINIKNNGKRIIIGIEKSVNLKIKG